MSKGYEWNLISDKKYVGGKYSITDIVAAIVTIIVLLIPLNIVFGNYTLLHYFGIDKSVSAEVGISMTALGIFAFLSARNIMQDLLFTILLVITPILILGYFGASVTQLKSDASRYVNGYEYGYSGNTYQQMANVPDQKPEPSSSSNPNKQKWAIIGTNQGLKPLSNLTAEGVEWCKTKAANETNQGRLHCNTGAIWNKNEWSQKNDTF